MQTNTDKITKGGHPLYVDLDGTFIKSDMLLETFLAAMKVNPMTILYVFFWALRGRANLKQKLVEFSEVNVSLVPVNPETYAFLQAQKSVGREIVLATASNGAIAEKFVGHYPIFDRYIASSPELNLKGSKKLEKIKQETNGPFDYMGNSTEDFILFSEAERSFLVNPTKKALQKSKNGHSFSDKFDLSKKATFGAWLKQLRVYQWLKNGLIFVPILVANQFTDFSAVVSVLVGFVSFGLLASSTYIINDLVDLDSDRQHTRKRNRPLASCRISIADGVLVAGLLFVSSFSIAWHISSQFFITLIIYLIVTLTYSLKVKRYFGMDVIALASLYTIRIFAGAAIIGVTVSFWLLSFSMFVFLSLALVKRCAELIALKLETTEEQVSGRDYNTNDLTVFTSFGTTSSLIAVLMYCFYLNAEVLSNQYQEPKLLWLVLPALGYWLIRMWVKTLRGEMHDDPIVYSLKDKGSLISIAIMGILTVVAQTL